MCVPKLIDSSQLLHEFYIKTTVFILLKGNYNGMKVEFSKVDWAQKLKDRSVDEQWQMCKQLIWNTQRELNRKRNSMKKRHYL